MENKEHIEITKPEINVARDGIGAVLSVGTENETLANKTIRDFSHIDISEKEEYEKTLDRINTVADNIRKNDFQAALEHSGYSSLKAFVETEKHLMTTTVASITKEIEDISHIKETLGKVVENLRNDVEAIEDYIKSEHADHSNEKLITSHLERVMNARDKAEKSLEEITEKLTDLETYKKTHVLTGINVLFSVESAGKSQRSKEAIRAWHGNHHHDESPNSDKITFFRINDAFDRINVGAFYAVAGSWKDCGDTGPFFYKLIVIISMLVAVSIGVYVIPHYLVIGICLAIAYASPLFVLLVVSSIQKKTTEATNAEIRQIKNTENKTPPLEIEPNSRLFHATKNLLGRKTTYTKEQFSEIADIFDVLKKYGLITSLARHGTPLTKGGHDVYISTPRKANIIFQDHGEAQNIFNYIRSHESPTMIPDSALLPILINIGVVNVHDDKSIGARVLSLGSRYDWYQKNLIGMAYKRFNSRRAQ